MFHGVSVMVKRKHIASAFLAVLFLAYYANYVFFYLNIEVVGVTVAHSHFPTNSSGKAHTHTENALELIAKLSVFQTFAIVLVLAGLTPFLFPAAVIKMCGEKKTISVINRGVCLRAPPLLPAL